MRLVVQEDFDAAERQLVAAHALAADVVGAGVLASRAGLTPETLDGYMKKLRDDVRKNYPDMDPRIEPTLMTMCRHALLVGIIAGKAVS